MDWTPRLLRVRVGERVVVLGKGRPKVLGPGRYGPMFGLPLTGVSEYLVFSARPVRHRAVLPGVRLADGEPVNLEAETIVGLLPVPDEELLDWAADIGVGELPMGEALAVTFESTLRRFCGTVGYARARRLHFELDEPLRAWAVSMADGPLEIRSVSRAVVTPAPGADARHADRRSRDKKAVAARADELTASALALLPTGRSDPLQRRRVLGWIDHADHELELLADLLRTRGASEGAVGTLLTKASIATSLLLLGALPGEEGRQALLSLYSWASLRESCPAQWPVLRGLQQRGDFDELRVMLGMIAPDLPSPRPPGPGRPWTMPGRLVHDPALRPLLRSHGIDELVEGACVAPTRRPGGRAVYLASVQAGELRDRPPGWDRVLNDASRTDRTVVLELSPDRGASLRAWFRDLVGPEPRRVEGVLHGDGTLTLDLLSAARPKDVPAWALHVFAEVVAGLTGVGDVAFRQS
ncbi:hypothetical protein AGRA3207_005045 [Actinomadura graeca]|uniref:Uncharacterized protein n=1 Tax=Actinomadura graeca TaxID=2750812 RepID=A0ABX8QYU3_9ACTN|nr:hypothetical protein [Actinomadura graeca]QXJ23833.1 hypothetical protein AGRA3207_005045 [Actinomadura graeca]